MFFSAHFRKKQKKPLFSGDFLPHILKNKGSLKKKKVFSARLGAQTPQGAQKPLFSEEAHFSG